jgi:hypothetical protein
MNQHPIERLQALLNENKQILVNFQKTYTTDSKKYTRLYVLKEPIIREMNQYQNRKPRTNENRYLTDSLQRSKTALKDLFVLNFSDPGLWNTLTFDPKKVPSRYDYDDLKGRAQAWLNLQRIKHGRFKYLLVPELHKRCEECVQAKAEECHHDERPKALHFHFISADYNGPVSKANTKSAKVVNLDEWTYGFSTGIPTDGSEKLASYMTKYMTKDMPQFNDKKRYWCSKGLKRPEKAHNQIIQPHMTLNQVADHENVSIFEYDHAL